MFNVISDGLKIRFPFVCNECGGEVDHDNGIGLIFAGTNERENIVRDVTWVVMDGTRGRVRPDDGCLTTMTEVNMTHYLHCARSLPTLLNFRA